MSKQFETTQYINTDFRGILLESGLFPLEEVTEDILNYIEAKKPLFKTYNTYSLEELHNYLDEVGINKSRVYLTTSTAPFVYFDEKAIILIEGTMFKEIDNRMKMELKKDLEYSLFMTNTPYKLFLLKYILATQKLTKTEAREYILNVYSMMEYNFTDFDFGRILKDTRGKPAKDLRLFKEKYLSKLGQKIMVFRGMTSASTPLNEALSWTLNEETAIFFATRFNSKGTVYQAEVDFQQILAYIDGSEEEVLVKPKQEKIIVKQVF